jgi:hypothetical protein
MTCASSVEEALYTTSLHPVLKAYPFKDTGDKSLQGLAYDVADDQDDDRAYDLWYVA